MTKPPFDDEILKLTKVSESTTMKLARQLENSPTVQVAQRLELHDIKSLMASAQRVSIACDAYTKSQQWAEISSSILSARRALSKMENFAALQTIDRSIRNLVLTAERAILPAVDSLQALSASAACAIQPLQDHFAKIEDWQSSIAQRMAALVTPWAMESHLGVSVTGFARIARLHDLATGVAPFTSQTVNVFREDLGQPISFEADAGPEDRENANMDAGMNPEIIAFPTSVYPSVLFCAGFEFRIKTIIGVESDKADNSGIFDPQHAHLLGQVENHLRMAVETELRTLAGESWYQSRVSGPTRKRWQERKEKDQQKRGDSYRLIFYADFMDLSEIICRKDNWKETFQRFFESKADLQVSLQRLSPVRKAIAHNRPLVRTDQIILCSEARRILTALGVQLH